MRFLSDVPLACWVIIAANLALSGYITFALWRILRTLSQVICVIGGENLAECMRYLR